MNKNKLLKVQVYENLLGLMKRLAMSLGDVLRVCGWMSG